MLKDYWNLLGINSHFLFRMTTQYAWWFYSYIPYMMLCDAIWLLCHMVFDISIVNIEKLSEYKAWLFASHIQSHAYPLSFVDLIESSNNTLHSWCGCRWLQHLRHMWKINWRSYCAAWGSCQKSCNKYSISSQRRNRDGDTFSFILT